MDPRRVLTFRAVAHQRSFSRAARQLSLSQPSVSNQVAALERELGTRLLERRPGGLRLTPEGEILLQHADAIAERFALADAQLPPSARASAPGCASAPCRARWLGSSRRRSPGCANRIPTPASPSTRARPSSWRRGWRPVSWTSRSPTRTRPGLAGSPPGFSATTCCTSGSWWRCRRIIAWRPGPRSISATCAMTTGRPR